MFSFPASDSEKQLVHSAMLKLRKSIEEATQAANELTELLDNEVLAVGSKYYKEQCDTTELLSAMFAIRVASCKMQSKKERIIESAN